MQQEKTANEYMIIDAHAHIFPPKIAQKATEAISGFYGIPMQHIGFSEELTKSGSQIGVSRYLVCSSATTPLQVQTINDYIADECARHPEFVGLGTLHPDMEDYSREIDRILQLKLHGIKLHPDFQTFNIDDPSAVCIYKKLAALKLPVLFHTGDARYDYSAPKRLGHVLEQVPDLVCIAAHFGGYQRWEEAHDYLKCDNIFFDTSSSLFKLSKNDAVSLIRYFGEDKFLFGSDFPMWDHACELQRFLDLGLPPLANEKILHANFEGIFGAQSV